MKTAITTITALLFGFTLAAQGQQVVSQPADCGVVTAEIRAADLPKAERFFERLKAAVKQGDRKAVAAMVRFPLRVNGKIAVANRAALLDLYDKVFDQKVLKAIRAERTECIFGNWKGFMAGNGAVWFDAGNDAKFKIMAVNNESWPKPTSARKK